MPTEEYFKRKKKYIARYNGENYRTMNLLFRKDDPEQMAAWDWVHSKYSTAGFVRDLILDAMRKEKEGK